MRICGFGLMQGSLSELDTQILLCVDLGFQSEDEISQIRQSIASLRSQIYMTIRSLQKAL